MMPLNAKSYKKLSSLSPIFPKLYKTDCKELILCDLPISYNDFLFLSSNVENIVLTFVVVKNEDGSIVPLEKLVKSLPKIKDIFLYDDIDSSCITLNTVKELLTIPRFSKISKISLHKIPETFDIETFFAFIKKNKIAKFDLRFADTVSDAYKIRLESIIDEILQTENHDYKVPLIIFQGLDREKLTKLLSLFDKN
uniref:Uncharacterized protein n=1 Tax=Panagrolaimus davidi TaxID=227884 RepID=A0A914P5N4_9BILA